jgi:hypothetical protein
MKTPAAHHPPLICRIGRGWMSVFGDATAGEPRGLGAGHVATCDDCRRFFSACDELEFALKRDAARHAPVVPTGLEQRIVRAVYLSAPEPHPRSTHFVPFALAGAAVCVALAVFVFQRRFSPPRAAAPTNFVIVADDVWTSLKPSANALLSGDPLQNEVDLMVSDARSAVRFLERNFLPSPPEPQGSSG